MNKLLSIVLSIADILLKAEGSIILHNCLNYYDEEMVNVSFKNIC